MFSVKENGTLIGFFTVCKINNGTVDIGLGMRPNITGNGFGLQFVNAGLAFSKEKYGCKYITLSVATFNERAIKVYKRAGFEAVGTFIQKTNGGCFEFLKMNYICNVIKNRGSSVFYFDLEIYDTYCLLVVIEAFEILVEGVYDRSLVANSRFSKER